MTTSSLAGDSIALMLPRALLLNKDRALATPAVRDVISQATGSADGTSGLAICLLLAYERSLANASNWAHYVEMLPKELPSLLHATLTNDEERLVDTLLARTSIGLSIRATRVELRERIRAVCAAAAAASASPRVEGGGCPWLTEESLLWAHAAFSSRAMLVPADPQPASSKLPFSFGPRYTHEPAMVPLMDFCNHRPGSTARFVSVAMAQDGAVKVLPSPSGAIRAPPGSSLSDMFDCLAVDNASDDRSAPAQKKQRVEASDSASLLNSPPSFIGLQLGAPLKELGSQVLISYGPKSNAELALHYGFVLQDNPADVLTLLLQRRSDQGSETIGIVGLKVVISGAVTSAEPGWAALSSHSLMPGLLCEKLVESVLAASASKLASQSNNRDSSSSNDAWSWALEQPELGSLRTLYGREALTSASDWVAQQLISLAEGLRKANVKEGASEDAPAVNSNSWKPVTRLCKLICCAQEALLVEQAAAIQRAVRSL